MPTRTAAGIEMKKLPEKKKYFLEYLSADAAARGVARGQLYKVVFLGGPLGGCGCF